MDRNNTRTDKNPARASAASAAPVQTSVVKADLSRLAPDVFVLLGENGEIWTTYDDTNRVAGLIEQAHNLFEKA